MDIYDPIAEALGINPTPHLVNNEFVFKIATNWNRIPWNIGKTYTLGKAPPERGLAISKAKKGKPINMRGEKHPNSKPLYCVNTGEHFASGGDVIRKYPNILRQNLSHHLKGKQKTVGGLVFTYSR